MTCPIQLTPSESEWRAVPGYEGVYEVSRAGQVRSLDRVVKSSMHGRPHWLQCAGRILKQSRAGAGYLKVSLCGAGGQKNTYVHTIVAAAFIGPRPAGMEIAHNDGCATNNQADNLRYATRAENVADTELHGTRVKGERASFAKLTESEVLAIRNSKDQQSAIADWAGISQSQVSHIRTGKSWGWLV